MTEREIREAVAGALGRAAVPDALWEENYALVMAAVRDERKLPELNRQIQRDWRILQMGRVTGGEPTAASADWPTRRTSSRRAGEMTADPEVMNRSGEDEASAYVRLRAAAVSDYFAAHAEAHGVAAFRERIFGGALKEEAAHTFLASPAVLFLSRQQFTDLGVPLTDHRSELLGEPATEFEPYTPEEFWAEVRVAQEAGRMPFEGMPPPAIFAFRDPCVKTLRIEWTGGVRELTVTLPEERRAELDKMLRPEHIGFPIRAASPYRIWPDSVLGDLTRYVERLMKDYPWQRERRVLWFILTGDTPFLMPIDMGYHFQHTLHFKRGTINLEIEPWVPAQVVSTIYLANQKTVLEGKNGRLRDRALEVFRFVVHQTRIRGSRPPWKELRLLWNEAHQARPEWRFERDSHFLGEYNRLEKVLITPEYRFALNMETIDGQSPGGHLPTR